MTLSSQRIREIAAAIRDLSSELHRHDDPEYRVLQAFMENAERELEFLVYTKTERTYENTEDVDSRSGS
jgi:hypothetical protein